MTHLPSFPKTNSGQVSNEHLRRVYHWGKGCLLLQTPGPVPFRTSIRWDQYTNVSCSWFELRTCLKRKRIRPYPWLWKKPIYHQKMKVKRQHKDATKKTPITARLWTDLVRLVGVTTVIQPVWLNRLTWSQPPLRNIVNDTAVWGMHSVFMYIK